MEQMCRLKREREKERERERERERELCRPIFGSVTPGTRFWTEITFPTKPCRKTFPLGHWLWAQCDQIGRYLTNLGEF